MCVMLVGIMQELLVTRPLDTLQTRLTEALDALHAFGTGKMQVSVSWHARAVQNTPASRKDIEMYARQLGQAIRMKETGAPARGPIYIEM